ncbi:MAG: CpsD/CapB family tyrosine-protein kinase [Clostridia bacterium]|nr:CpsD/CapB family tyrosine-protein kinase [Clostridia bacterium]
MANKYSISKHPLLTDATPFAVREAFNHLRINLNYSVKNENCPIYAITSAAQDIGKSTIISNLAISMSQASKRVLLIDGDMRLPVLGATFGLEKNATGLSEILSGILSDPKEAVQHTSYEHLDVITSGRIPPNPSELLEGDIFPAMLKLFAEEYDAILIDFPPVGAVADALALSRYITGYLVAVRSEKSDSIKLRRAIEVLKSVDAKILGVVLNEINPKGKSYQKYHGYDYAYQKNESK